MTGLRRFVFGLGHQKCGTTWLYEYLAASDRFHNGVLREYHVWDGLDVDLLRRNLVTLDPADQAHVADRARDGDPDSVRYLMQHDPDYYFEYFASLYSDDGDRAQQADADPSGITADITPTYCALGSDRLTSVDASFADRGIEVQAVILLRDPIERIKSAVRHRLRKIERRTGKVGGVPEFEQALHEEFTSAQGELRSDYPSTITEAERAFPPERIYVGIFESMFSPAEIERLSAFLGVSPRPELAEVKVNESKTSVDSTKFDADIAEHYKDVYDFCFERFPVTRELWA